MPDQPWLNDPVADDQPWRNDPVAATGAARYKPRSERGPAPRQREGVRYGNLVLPTGAAPTAPVRPATALERRARPAPPRPQETPVQRTQRIAEQYVRDRPGGTGASSADVQLSAIDGAFRLAGGMADTAWMGIRPAEALTGGPMPSQTLRDWGLSGYNPASLEGEMAQGATMMAGNAMFGGGPLSVILPTLGGEAFRNTSRAMGYDEPTADIARGAGQLTAGLASAIRLGRSPSSPPGTPSRGIRNATATTTPTQMRAEAARLRAEGFDPTLVDVTDEAGRGVIRNAASRQTPARTQVQVRNDRLRVNALREAPARAARLTPGEERPAVDVLASVEASRRANAVTDYAAAAGERVQVEPFADELIDQRDALLSAAKTLRTNKNYDAAAEVDALLARLDDGQPMFGDVSVAAADQIKQELLLGARNAAGGIGTKTSQAPGLTSRGTNIDNYLADQSDNYATARDNYAAASQRMEGLERGNILSMSGAQGTAAIRAMTPAGREGAKVAVRQQIQDMFTGATNADTPLRRLAVEDDMRVILSELFSPQEADDLARYAEVARQRLNRMAYVSPNTGPQSANRLMDGVADVADEALTAGVNVASGNRVGLVRGVIRWARESGLTDDEAQLLAEAAIDPSRTDEIIASLGGNQSPRLLAALRRIGGPAAAIAGSATASQAQARPGPPRR